MSKQRRVIVVGAGLFGSIMGRAVEAKGFPVVYLDDLRPGAGSPASAGLIKPSWLDGFGNPGRVGLEVLKEMFELEVIQFKILGRLWDLYHLDPERVLVRFQDRNLMRAKVTAVGDGYVEYVMTSDRHTSYGPLRLEGTVLVTTGVWAQELVPGIPDIQRLMGTAFFYKGKVAEPVLDVWAPYKQVKVFNRPGGLIWAGDSTGLLPKSYTKVRMEASERRVEKYVWRATGEHSPLSHSITGARPYLRGMKAGLFEQVHPNTYVATGGGKMGSVLAGWMAHRFVQALTGGSNG